MYTWNFTVLWLYKDALLEGLLVTVVVSVYAIVLGTLLGIVLSAARTVGGRVLSYLAVVYTEVVIALPVLVMLVWIYYCLPIVGLRISGFWTSVVALSLSLGAFSAELFRGGIMAIPRGQVEAARVLGIPERYIFSKIVMPQVARIVTPPLATNYISTIKFSSLGSVVATPEILYRANDIISATYRPLEMYTVVAALYIALVWPLSALTRIIEARYKLRI